MPPYQVGRFHTNLWAAYFANETDEFPSPEAVQEELERLQELYGNRLWKRS